MSTTKFDPPVLPSMTLDELRNYNSDQKQMYEDYKAKRIAAQPPATPEADEWPLAVKIEVSLDEAETIQALLDDNDEDHLSEHVKWCIQDAKKRAGLLLPAAQVKGRE